MQPYSLRWSVIGNMVALAPSTACGSTELYGSKFLMTLVSLFSI